MDTPVPIPNTAVKHLSADNTWLETARESKSLPDLYQGLKRNSLRPCLFCNRQIKGGLFSTPYP